MEEKILAILEDINENIITYDGDNLFDAGILDSIQVIDIVADLECELDIDIDARLVIEENFKTTQAIIEMVKSLV